MMIDAEGERERPGLVAIGNTLCFHVLWYVSGYSCSYKTFTVSAIYTRALTVCD